MNEEKDIIETVKENSNAKNEQVEAAKQLTIIRKLKSMTKVDID